MFVYILFLYLCLRHLFLLFFRFPASSFPSTIHHLFIYLIFILTTKALVNNYYPKFHSHSLFNVFIIHSSISLDFLCLVFIGNYYHSFFHFIRFPLFFPPRFIICLHLYHNCQIIIIHSSIHTFFIHVFIIHFSISLDFASLLFSP